MWKTSTRKFVSIKEGKLPEVAMIQTEIELPEIGMIKSEIEFDEYRCTPQFIPEDIRYDYSAIIPDIKDCKSEEVWQNL